MDQQQTPINPRLDSSVLPTQPAEDWAAEARNALGTTESPSVGHASHVVQSTDSSALDMTAKPQSSVDHVIQGSHSAVSTPGQELPGAWSEKPATANQVLNDAGNALASVGNAAYNALPESVKGAFSTQTTNTSPVQTTTNHTTTTPSQNLTETAQSTLSKIAEVGTLAAGTAATGATAVYERVAGTNTGNADIRKDVGILPAHEPASLPSQDVYGQPSGVASDGAGALPGHSGETGVAILPDDKAALANKSELPTQHTTTSQPTWTDSAKSTALGAAGATTAAATTLSTSAQDAYNHPGDYVPSTAQHAYNHPEEYIPGMPKSEENTMPYHQAQTLPSQDKQGQLPLSGKMDGVGALPGGVDEESVAVLPEEKVNPNPLAPSEFAGAKTNTTIVDPYNSKSPYSNTDANAISQPHNAPVSGTSTSGTTGETTKEKVETKAEEVKDKVMPHKSSTTETSSSPSNINTTTKPPTTASTDNVSTNSSGTSPTKKAGFMDKLKGQSKIISGKISKNEEKIAEGQALKSGNNAHP